MPQVPELTRPQALAARLHALRLAGPGVAPVPALTADPAPADAAAAAVARLVTWFGALQGQDARSLAWSLGVRLPGTTASVVVAAARAAGVVRTWPMRGTLHLVPGRDARWMLELMGGRPTTAELARRRQLGISEADPARACDVLGEALAGVPGLSREECVARLAAAGLPVAGQAAYHLLAAACRQGTACLLPEPDGGQTFALLDDVAPDPRRPDPDEALAEIALRFVRSHGPVARRDLAGWTGLPLRAVDRGLAARDDLVPVRVDGVPMVAWAPGLDAAPAGAPAGHLLLPGFDEYLLGYKDRSLQLDAAHREAIVPGGNGVFVPTMVRAGRVVGTWRRAVGRGPGGATLVRLRPLVRLGSRDRRAFERAAAGYGCYLDGAVEVRWEEAWPQSRSGRPRPTGGALPTVSDRDLLGCTRFGSPGILG